MNDYNVKQDLEARIFFPSMVYFALKPEFLKAARKVSYEYLNKFKMENDPNPINPLYQTESFQHDKRISELVDYIGKVCWSILDDQGYRMNNLGINIEEFWCHEYNTTASMDKHIHGQRSMLSGFYFIDCPQDSTKLALYDPRSSKEYYSLPEKDDREVTIASNSVVIQPEEGLLCITNSWLPHAFSRNASEEPSRMIHFSVNSFYYEQKQPTVI